MGQNRLRAATEAAGGAVAVEADLTQFGPIILLNNENYYLKIHHVCSMCL